MTVTYRFLEYNTKIGRTLAEIESNSTNASANRTLRNNAIHRHAMTNQNHALVNFPLHQTRYHKISEILKHKLPKYTFAVVGKDPAKSDNLTFRLFQSTAPIRAEKVANLKRNRNGIQMSKMFFAGFGQHERPNLLEALTGSSEAKHADVFLVGSRIPTKNDHSHVIYIIPGQLLFPTKTNKQTKTNGTIAYRTGYNFNSKEEGLRILQALPLLKSKEGTVNLYSTRLVKENASKILKLPPFVLWDLLGMKQWNNSHALSTRFKNTIRTLARNAEIWSAGPTDRKSKNGNQPSGSTSQKQTKKANNPPPAKRQKMTEKLARNAEIRSPDRNSNNGNQPSGSTSQKQTKKANNPPPAKRQKMTEKVYHVKVYLPNGNEGEILILPKNSTLRLRRYKDVRYHSKNIVENTADYIYRLSNTKQNGVHKAEIDSTILVPHWMKVIEYTSIEEGQPPRLPSSRGKVLFDVMYTVRGEDKTFVLYPHGTRPSRNNNMIKENKAKGIRRYEYMDIDQINLSH
jgi:hypothetical protein